MRMVPKDWKHPTERAWDRYGQLKEQLVPLFNSISLSALRKLQAGWDEQNALWVRGEHPDQLKYPDASKHFEEWAGERPSAKDRMPCWEPSERTHFQMYENTTEGTPISPVCETAEELARWLADNRASAFGRETATYEQWLSTIQRGFSFSMVANVGGPIVSGVVGQHDE